MHPNGYSCLTVDVGKNLIICFAPEENVLPRPLAANEVGIQEFNLGPRLVRQGGHVRIGEQYGLARDIGVDSDKGASPVEFPLLTE